MRSSTPMRWGASCWPSRRSCCSRASGNDHPGPGPITLEGQADVAGPRAHPPETLMPTLRRWKAVLILAGAAAWGAFPAAGARAQTPGHPDCLEQLACMSWEELERLYRDSGPGAIPVGYARGRAIYCPGARLSGVKSGVANALWHGKHFAA